ncbi:transcriptional regulator [Microtetraspora sp. NBRC 13810]|uniref:helix-turn-helix domain-containing protein n=1 Tax=Microtetraspora sp. NBRC 13810 TaxID=3030990 RepID=UPI0024A436EB|nr:helix-turn-helix domain-containing protein [Microtetraspora sp. NBRC 13810]GLW08660.1 transcriptional regulator [Microtetraspora sp. NBRC 13810]
MTAPDDGGARRIGGNVRAARRARGISLEALAGLAGRSKGWLSKIENGRARLDRRSDIAALAEALQVSADFLLGGPAPEIRPERRHYNLMPLQRVLMDAAPDDPPDIRARPLDVLRAELGEADAALRHADYATIARILPAVIGELYAHAAAGREPARSEALKLLVLACGSDGTAMLRHLGETNLAYISGERGRQAADLLGDPVWRGAAAYGQAHARSSANKPKPLMVAARIADEVEPHIGDDPFAHQVHGMLRLSAALSREVQGDHDGAAEQAAEAARLAEPLGDAPEAFELFGVANVGVWRASLAVEAGRPGDALRFASEVDPRALASDNRRAALHVEKARALGMLDRGVEAVRELKHAERLSPVQVHNHPLIRELVTDMLDRAGGRDLRGLAWRMNLI